MEVHNRDLFPSHDLQRLYDPIAPLITNSVVDKPFLAHEKSAKLAKAYFHLAGRVGMLLVLLSSLYTIAQPLVLPSSPSLKALTLVFIVIGISGLAIQVHLLLQKKKQRWLSHRFAAERLRSIKFQGYQVAMISASTEELRELANEFYAKEVARLNSELNSGYSALTTFSPSKALPENWITVDRSSNPAIESLARDAYRELRIVYQRLFAEGEIEALQQNQRVGYTLADLLYLLGAALAICALTAELFTSGAGIVSHWIDFLAIAAFVCGLFKTILDNASLSETSKIRYEGYLHALDECETELKAEYVCFPEIVRRIERVVLEELSDFCQSASHISYRL